MRAAVHRVVAAVKDDLAQKRDAHKGGGVPQRAVAPTAPARQRRVRRRLDHAVGQNAPAQAGAVNARLLAAAKPGTASWLDGRLAPHRREREQRAVLNELAQGGGGVARHQRLGARHAQQHAVHL